MLLEDYLDAVYWLAARDGAVPAGQWVDEIRAENDRASFEGLL